MLDATIALFILILLNIALLIATKGWMLSGIVGLLTFAICAVTLTDGAIYSQILFAPYMQIMTMFTALVCMIANARSA